MLGAPKQDINIAFCDVTKAHDKAWLDVIMYTTTKYGHTRKIAIKDSIRQGGVLSVLQYGLFMDETSKEIAKEDLGIKIAGMSEAIGYLLWVDNVI